VRAVTTRSVLLATSSLLVYFVLVTHTHTDALCGEWRFFSVSAALDRFEARFEKWWYGVARIFNGEQMSSTWIVNKRIIYGKNW